MTSLFEEFQSALHSVWHRRWLALVVAWAVCLIGWLVVALIPNTYESRARIFVQLDDALAQQVGIAVEDRKRDIERIRQTLTSAVNLEKVVRSTKLGETIESPKQLEAAVLDLAKDVKVVSQQDNLFEITATANKSSLSEAENAQLAQNIAQKLIDIFEEENLRGNRGEMTETLEFVNKQLAERQAELEKAEQRRLMFESEHPEMIQGGAVAVQKLEASRSQQRALEADLAAAQSALAAINGQLAGTPQMLPGGMAGSASASLAQAQSDMSAMRARGLTSNQPDVISVRNQIAALKEAARREGTSNVGMPNPAYTSLLSIKAERDANVQALESRLAGSSSDVAEYSALRISNPALAEEAHRISRDYDVLRQQYEELLRDREELRLRGEIKTEREAVKFQVVDPPTTPRAPVAPQRPLLLLGVLLVGSIAGCAAAFAIGKLRSTFSTSAALERGLDLPVLGAISATLTAGGRDKRKRDLKFFYSASGALGGLFMVLVIAEFIQRGTVA